MSVLYWKEKFQQAMTVFTLEGTNRERIKNAYNDALVYLEQEINDVPKEIQNDYNTLSQMMNKENLKDDEVEETISLFIDLYDRVIQLKENKI